MMELWKKLWVTETLLDVLVCTVSIWIAIMMGLFIGWSWKPKWTTILFLGLRSRFQCVWTTIPPGFGARRIWFAITAISLFSVCRTLWSSIKGKEEDIKLPAPSVSSSHYTETISLPSTCCTEMQQAVCEDDLKTFMGFIEGKDGSLLWQSIMEKTTPNMKYHAWCHDPKNGLFVFRSRTVFEDTAPELVRDFLWDDEFRKKWDPMLGHCKVLEQYPSTGLMIVQWVRKFPFFCSDREYIIGQRIWEDANAYYCVTKGVPYPGLPRRKKPKRVDVYSSSWTIKAVESRRGDGEKTSCEVVLIHYEDMGIPKDVAKLGVRHGMWGTVKRLHGGLRLYQNFRRSDSPISASAKMAGVTTMVSSAEDSVSAFSEGESKEIEGGKDKGFDWKLLFLGAAIAIVCARSGSVGRALSFGADKRIHRR